MISKIVHNHIPEKQYEHECLKKYLINTEENKELIDIDYLFKRFN